MKIMTGTSLISAALMLFSCTLQADRWHDYNRVNHADKQADQAVQLGPRPFYLVEGMDEGELKDKLLSCRSGPFYKSDFSIAHRGAAMQFPEHSDVSYEAGARMGAGIVECDVTYTADGVLVCRHSECDLHTTTNIVATDLNNRCTVPWTGPFDQGQNPAPVCCTSDLTLREFKSLEAKMDASDPGAVTPEGYLGGTANWRTDLYTARAKVLTFSESIELNQTLDVKHTPELKGASFQDRIDAVFGSQQAYAQAFANELLAGNVKPRDVWAQSFNVNDVLYWIDNTRYGKQAVYLLDYSATADDIVIQTPFDQMDRDEYFKMLKKRGVKIVAPPVPALLRVDDGEIVPSALAHQLKANGFDIITWTFERSDVRQGAAQAGFYYDFDPTGAAIKKDADIYKALDVLAKEVKILGIFSDWPATVTYYANCMKLK